MTFGLLTLNITTLSFMTLSTMKFSIMTLRIMTLSIMTLSIMTFSKYGTMRNINKHSIAKFKISNKYSKVTKLKLSTLFGVSAKIYH